MADEQNTPLYLDPQILARDLDNSLAGAARSTTSPDDESQLRAASRRLGVPLDTARTNPAETKLALERESFDAADYAKRFPTSAAYLSNPDNALLARDDVGPLSAVEKAVLDNKQHSTSFVDSLERGIGQLGVLGELTASGLDRALTAIGRRFLPEPRGGWDGVNLTNQSQETSLASVARGYSEMPRDMRVAVAARLVDDAAANGTTFSGVLDAVTYLTKNPGAVVNFMGEMLPSAVVGGGVGGAAVRPLAGAITNRAASRFATGAAVSGAAAATGAYPSEFANRLLDNGGNVDEAMSYAALKAGTEGGVNAVFGGLGGALPIGSTLGGRVGNILGQTGAQATGGASGAAAASAVVGETISAGELFLEAFLETVTAPSDIAIASFVQAQQNAVERQEARALAAASGDQLQTLLTAAAASMTRQRDPQSFAQLVQDAATQGGALTEVFIDANTLVDILEQSGIAPDGLGQLLPSVVEQLEEADATDGLIAIPIGELTAAFAGTGVEQLLAQNSRTSPDAWTAAEAAEATDLMAQLESDAQTVLEAQTEKQAWEESSNAVFNEVLGELNTAGRFTPDVNRAYATLLKNYYSTQAANLGMTPEQLFNKFRLSVSSRAPGQQAQVLDQGSSRFSEDNRLSNLSMSGPSWERIRAANPSLKSAATADDEVTIYRATIGDSIRPDDFVAVDRDVAEMELENVIDRDGDTARIIEQRVKVRDLLMGNDATEFVYFPDAQTLNQSAPAVSARQLSDQLESQYPGLKLDLLGSGDRVTLSRIVLPKEGRGQGTGTAVMNAVVQWADQNGKTIGLTPSGDFGGSKSRLPGFYKRFGFVENKGKNRDFEISEGMYRAPAQATSQTLNQSVKQTDTPEFRNWFGDSKVREPLQSSKQRFEDMPPLVVYHGTQTDFDSFAATRTGVVSSTLGGEQEVVRNGIFFAENPDFAATFAEQGGGQAARVMPVYLNIRNPLYLDEGFTKDLREELESAGFTGAADLRFVTAENVWSTLDGEVGAALVAAAKKAGYDGIYMREEAVGLGDDTEPQNVWVTFDPEQIKSAVGNRGTFDPADPNILNQSTVLATPEQEAAYAAAVAGNNRRAAIKLLEEAAGVVEVDASFNRDGAHDAPAPGSGSPLYDLNRDGTYPDDLYGPNGLKWYGAGDATDGPAYTIIKNLEARPNAPVKIYRAVPNDGTKKILGGDWVTTVRQYAKDHGEGALGGDYKIISMDVYARDLFTSGDSFVEYGYHPQPFKPEFPKSEAAKSRSLSEAAANFAAAHPESVAQQGEALNQSTGARATFNPATLEIALLEKADLSSFLHETGHFFFEMQAMLAAQPDAPQQVVDDMQALLTHVGFTGTVQEWLAQPVDARREAHETVAETFEQYLFEGKAPTPELHAAFRRFRSWLISVYRSLQQMLATNKRSSLTPEVSAIFDRMIATDEAIASAQAVREFEPMFRSAEDAGMTPEQWASYRSDMEQHQADAIDELQARTVRDLKWLDNAKGRKLKELQKEAAAQRKAVRDEVTAEVNNQPVYRAMEFLKRGVTTGENGEQIQVEVTKAAKLNINDLQTMYPEGELATAVDWKNLGYGKYGMLSDAGLHPDTVAEIFGFRSGRQLVTELLNAEPKASVIDGMTDQRMLERYGDISSPEAMAEAANEAIANDARARLVATELQAVTKATGKPSVLLRAARQAAERIVASKPVRNLRPDMAAASANRARKAAAKAMASGDTAAAAAAKRTEILQVQLERVQRATQKEHDKALRDFKKIFKGSAEKLAKSRDVAMVNAARAVLARYGLAPQTGAAQAQAYAELLANYDGTMTADIQSILQGLPPAGDFRDLTVEQFNGMRDVVNGLYYLSRRTRQMEIDGQKVEIDAVADEIVQIVTDRSGGTIPMLPGYAGTPTSLDKWKASLQSAKASLTRVEFWADNWGPTFKKYIWFPVTEATTTMVGKRNKLIKQYRDLLKGIEKGLTYNKIDAPELGATGFVFNAGKTELLHAVLHSGNQSNLTKLLVGRGWGTLDAEGRLDTSKWDAFVSRMIDEGVLTKADFDFAQGVWDLLETVKVDAQAAHKEMYGYYFNEVTADPIVTPFGTYRGGYVPALADSLSSPDMAQKREQEDLLHAGNSFMFPTTGKGFTQSRVQYNRPLELDLRTIGRHLDKVARFAYLEPTIKDVMQLIGNKRVARALNGASPGAISDMLMPWLQRTARQTVALPGKNTKLNGFFNGLRTRTGLQFMFGNVINTLQQLTGFSLSWLKIPAPAMLRATAGYLANPMKMRRQVGERSPWLAERMSNQSYAMQDQIEEILTNPGVYTSVVEFARRHAYFLQQAMQNVMDPIVWTGAYDHALAKGATEKEAVRYADETVRTTQGSFAPEDISSFEVQAPFTRLFTQFYGYFNMWGNLLGNEANKAVREAGFVGASPRLLFIWFAGMAIPAFVAEMISQGLPDDEDDEDGDGLLDEYLAMFFGAQAKSLATMVPIAGHMTVLAANQMDNKMWNDRLNTSPAISAGESAAKGVAAIATGELFDEDLTKNEVRSILTLIGLGTGLPTGPVSRAVGYVMDVDEGRKNPETALEMGIGITTGR